MGLPEILIEFKTKAETAVRRSQKRNCGGYLSGRYKDRRQQSQLQIQL